MAPAVLFILIATFLVPTHSHLEPTDQAFTSVVLSQQGLDFLKDLLIDNAISSIIPLQLPNIEKSLKIPFVGTVYMVLSNSTIYEIDVSESFVKPGDTGIVIIASGATCNLSMKWYYSYSTWLVPVQISDTGSASVQDISIKLDGGASWLYQGMVDAFEEKIGSAVEKAITKKLKEGILKLDSLIQGLPKEIPVDDNASLNVTFVNDPLLSDSSIGFEINGLFTERKRDVFANYRNENSQPSVFCPNSSQMIGISLDEAVFNSASALYYNAAFMQWIVDKVPDQSLLNTGGWRFIIPQLYKKYPNDDMNLNITLSSPPVIKIAENDIDAAVNVDLVIDVLEAGEVTPVACISLVIRASGSVKITGNNLAGSMKLNDFTMSLKWSNIGNLRLYLIQPVMWTLIQTVFLPYANSHLAKGFPLPIIHGFTLQNAEIICSESRIMVCSDVSYTHNLSQLLINEVKKYIFQLRDVRTCL
ncbi:hypothetical protein CJ030_MR6G024798 [Morella rubra]|uniref:Lipid-binding serum glycoprotein C-terminal domain-containing protein n=1 Tax=Morella rubra TaxID=262757 RepID=A0A6A1V7E0_9ROSI|nr:hypothetical protein CJ030_MR6G024798 [Morella rubra]